MIRGSKSSEISWEQFYKVRDTKTPRVTRVHHYVRMAHLRGTCQQTSSHTTTTHENETGQLPAGHLKIWNFQMAFRLVGAEMPVTADERCMLSSFQIIIDAFRLDHLQKGQDPSTDASHHSKRLSDEFITSSMLRHAQIGSIASWLHHGGCSSTRFDENSVCTAANTSPTPLLLQFPFSVSSYAFNSLK